MILEISPVKAHAAGTILPGCYDPADYIQDITISGETKTVTYDFSEIRYMLRSWDNGTGKSFDSLDSLTVEFDDGATQNNIVAWPFGTQRTQASIGSKGGALYVGDILPGSPIEFEFGMNVLIEWVNEGQPFTLTVTTAPKYYLYDANGDFLSLISGDKSTAKYTLDSRVELHDEITVSGVIPADAAYIAPELNVYCSFPMQEQLVHVGVSLQGGHSSMSVQLNTILENSNQMSAINDKLDNIWSGGQAGEDLGAAGDHLDSSNQNSSDSMSGVTDFENGLMSDAQDKLDDLDQIQIVTGVGDFSDSILWVSGYVTDIFDGVENWSIVISLPLFLGIVFYICQYAGNASRVVRSARERSDAAALSARREAEMKGHISSGSSSETYYVYQESLW